MAPKLNFLGRKLFFEHMILNDYYDGREQFFKTLILNRQFLFVANKYEIYHIDVNLNKDVHLYFRSYILNPITSISLTFQQACQMLKFLKPPLVQFSYYSLKHTNFNVNDFLDLMEIPNRKIGLSVCQAEHALFVLENVWQRIDKLHCPADLLGEIEETHLKLFDKLEVNKIQNTDELNTVLKHPSKELCLEFRKNFVYVDDKDVSINNNCAKQCKLDFNEDIKNANQIASVVQKIANTCNQLKELKIEYYNSFEYDWADFVSLLNHISHQYRLFAESIKLIRQTLPNVILNVEASAFNDTYRLNFETPGDWQQQLKKIDELRNAVIEEEFEQGRNTMHINLEIKDDLTDATFYFMFYYST